MKMWWIIKIHGKKEYFSASTMFIHTVAVRSSVGFCLQQAMLIKVKPHANILYGTVAKFLNGLIK